MFVSQESNRRFKKPNILRRKPKAPALAETLNVSNSNRSSNTRPDITNTLLRPTIKNDLQLENITKYDYDVRPFQTGHKESGQSLNIENSLLYSEMGRNQEIELKQHGGQGVSSESSLLVYYTEENPVQSSVNVESFFNETQPKYHKQAEVPSQQFLDNLSVGSTKFKCDVPNCNKEFRSAQKLKRHKYIHNKDLRLPRQVTSECPVKKVNPDGTEQRCGQIYLIREQLVKHLKEDHTIDDAAYRCDECGRQFFWASGLRAHSRSHSPRARPAASLVCGWQGCGRVFSQPCRLREHARAHTGDRPYPCTFPNCGSSFRSASKLERHARRHTGLRRHACARCGRAFLRREHLRDHCARHHRPRPPPPPPPPPPLCCLHSECKELFEDADALQEHINKEHSNGENSPVHQPNPADNLDYIFLAVEDTEAVTEEPQMEKSCVELEEASESQESRAARTHCPWPMAVRLRDLTAEEQGDGSESNIYTVRSDLFLHGNVLINEDSVQMGGAVESTEPTTETSNDELGLGLLEHPHIDLLQEEMMFTVWP
ncbi:zinc finger protein 157-like [Plodia interpunctella]|uniref:zinc finger protein 157-like n=1 Tax=Plodia interpunctella TaxID=58824 RepID=UPI0023686554|nr:zinc finger protein 157-like [Plodia interpunctella]XP_053612182.1 zinc finger protein 157-like [Plodia interpunctella]